MARAAWWVKAVSGLEVSGLPGNNHLGKYVWSSCARGQHLWRSLCHSILHSPTSSLCTKTIIYCSRPYWPGLAFVWQSYVELSCASPVWNIRGHCLPLMGSLKRSKLRSYTWKRGCTCLKKKKKSWKKASPHNGLCMQLERGPLFVLEGKSHPCLKARNKHK